MEYDVIALDAMGGDHGPKVTIPAALRVLKKHKHLKIILVGQEDVLNRYLKRLHVRKHKRISVHHAEEIVEMDELPSQALRGKKDSSMRVAINLVKEGTAHACVSAGNTGALMATAKFVLKTLPGISRPAIMSIFPGIGKHTHVLDLGANIESTPEQLFQFAVMGSVLTAAVNNIDNPTVGLLNVGTEEIKGIELVKDTAQLLSDCDHLNYIGYVEGNDMFRGTADVVVCDGFVGNVALKTCEGVAKYIRAALMDAFNKNIFTKFCAALAAPVLLPLKNQISPERYNGASLVGLNGIVIKSHGSSRAWGFSHAIEEAVLEVEKNVPERIRAELEAVLQEDSEKTEQDSES